MHTFKNKDLSPTRRKPSTKGVNRTHDARVQSFEKVPVDKKSKDSEYRQSQDTHDAFSQIIRETKTYFMNNNESDNLKVSFDLNFFDYINKLDFT